MKKCILSAMAGAVAMFLFLLLIANMQNKQEEAEYVHIDFVSDITQEECFVCKEQGPYWGEDNVGIVNLNSFELLHLPINRYSDRGELVEEPAGVMLLLHTERCKDYRLDGRGWYSLLHDKGSW